VAIKVRDFSKEFPGVCVDEDELGEKKSPLSFSGAFGVGP